MKTSPSDEFTEFVAATKSSLRRHALALCRDWHDAEDLTQTVLLRMYSHWPHVAGLANPAAYAHQTMINAFLAERRHVRWQREELHDRMPESAADEPGGPEDRSLLLEALSRLGPRQRAVVVLRICEDLSVAQTMEIMQCSAATVRSQLARAMPTLRSALSTTLGRP